MIDDETDDVELLRRRVRAVASVNRDLHAELALLRVELAVLRPEPVDMADEAGADDGDDGDDGQGSLTARADGWLRLLADRGEREAVVVRSEDGLVFVVEGGRRRPVRSGLLANTLEVVLGPAQRRSQAELAGLREGPPVEALAPGDGSIAVVVGGRRLVVRGLPAEVPVSADLLAAFPAGPELEPARAHVARAQADAVVERVQALEAELAAARSQLAKATAAPPAPPAPAWKRLLRRVTAKG